MGKRRGRGRALITRQEDIPAGWRALASYPRDQQKILSDADLPSVRLCITDNHARTGPVYLDPEAVERVLQLRQRSPAASLRQSPSEICLKLEAVMDRIEQLHQKIDRLM